jgi:hypothetical protein
MEWSFGDSQKMKNEKNLEENTVGTCSNVLKQKAILFGSEYMNEEIITATKCFFKKNVIQKE